MLRSAFIAAAIACLVAAGCSTGSSSNTSEGQPNERKSAERAIRPSAARAVAHETVFSRSPPSIPSESVKYSAKTTATPILQVIDSDTGPSTGIVADLIRIVGADRLDIRAVPSGGTSNDLLALMKSEVDLGIMQSDAWSSLPDDVMRAQAREQVQYIAGLYTKEIHILASREIADVRGLNRRKVNIGAKGSGTNWTARRLFAQLDIEPLYEEHDHELALERLRAGEVDAAVVLEHAPSALLEKFPQDPRFHLLPLNYDDEAILDYLPGRLEAATYPKLIAGGTHVETVAVRTVLAVPKEREASDRYRRLVEFTSRFFKLYPKLAREGNSEWAAVQPSVVVNGWERFAPAQRMLESDALLEHNQLQPVRSRPSRPGGQVHREPH